MLPLNKEEREIPRLPRLFAVDIASLALMTLHFLPQPAPTGNHPGNHVRRLFQWITTERGRGSEPRRPMPKVRVRRRCALSTTIFPAFHAVAPVGTVGQAHGLRPPTVPISKPPSASSAIIRPPLRTGAEPRLLPSPLPAESISAFSSS